MPTPLDYARNPAPGDSHSFTLNPNPQWTPLSAASVGCCWLFVAGVAGAAIIHPSIPPALVVMILLAAPAAGVLGLVVQHRSGGAPVRGAKGATMFGSAVTVLGLAVSLMLPALCRAREPANRVKCASNLRQIGYALSTYADGHAGRFPPDLATLAAASDLPAATFVCPSSNDSPALIDKPSDWAAAFQPDSHQCSYIYLAASLSKSNVNSESILACENPENHLDTGMNVLYGDFHVEWVPKAEADRIIAAHYAATEPTTRAGE